MRLLVVLLALLGSVWTLPLDYTYVLPVESREHTLNPSVRYNGHKLVRIVNPSAKLHAAVSDGSIDVWSAGRDYITVRVPDLATLSQWADKRHETLETNVVVEDVQKLLDEQNNAVNQHSMYRRDGLPADWFNAFHPYEETVDFLNELCSSYEDICRFIPSIGKTQEGRDIVALSLGSPGENKPQVYLQSLLHAREWAATMTSQYILHRLLTTYGNDTQVTEMMDDTELLFVPVSNPDGYVYTWTTDRLWRKNRRDNGNSSFGVDLNRNWDLHWGKGQELGDPSSNPNSEVYMGPSVESEPETKALANFVRQQSQVIVGIDMHSYSQLLLRPLSDSMADIPHEKQMREVFGKMGADIKAVHGKDYLSQKSVEMYPTTGTAGDWFYGLKNNKIGNETVYPYDLTIEVRPSNENYGFILPADQIIPLGEEVFAGYVSLVKSAMASPLTDANAGH